LPAGYAERYFSYNTNHKKGGKMRANFRLPLIVAIIVAIFTGSITFAEDFKAELVKVEYYKDTENTKCTAKDYIIVRELYKVYNIDMSDLVYTRVNTKNEPYSKPIKYFYKSGNVTLIHYGYCMHKDAEFTIKVRFLSLKSENKVT